MYKFLFSLLLCLGIAKVFAQSYIRGTIVDENKKPIPNATIFFNNTQIGTKSNDQGSFALYSEQNQTEIVVSCIGFETLKISNPVHNTKYRIILKEQQHTLNEVVIGQKVKNKAQWQPVFYRLLMGNDSHDYAGSRLINPEVVSYYYDGKQRKLTVVNTAPMEILHPTLGYIMKVDLIKFEFDLLSEKLNREVAVFYEDKYRNSQKQSIQIATNKSYYGSKRHFLSALATNCLAEEGFDIFQYHSVKNLAKEQVINRLNNLKLKKILGGFDETHISLHDLFDHPDTIKFYEKTMYQKDYLSRRLDTLKASDIVKYSDTARLASIQFTDTILVKYNVIPEREYLHTKYRPIIKRYGQHETLVFMIDQKQPIQINDLGFSIGNNIFFSGDMSTRGLSQELPKDSKPARPRFTTMSALLRDP